MTAGIVDEDVDPAEFELRLLEQVDAGFRVGDIHRENLDPGPVAQFFGDRLEVLLRAGDEHEIGARLREHPRRRRTHALGSARDDDGLVFEDHAKSLARKQRPLETMG